MILVEPPPYLPFLDPRLARKPGLVPLEGEDWLLVAPDYAAQMARREELIETRREIVLATLPEGEAPAGELLDVVLDTIAADGRWQVGAGAVTRPDGAVVAIDRDTPMETLGRIVQEDLCLLVPDPESGEYKLVAAVLCFPSRWLLSEKIGRAMTAIHVPVPDYDEALARRVNRLFEAIRPGREVYRINWIVHPTAELHLPIGLSDKLMLRAKATGEMFLRTERQVLRRLPRTGAVVFSIKTSVSRLSSLEAGQARAMAEALGALEPEVLAYRGFTDLRGDAVAQLLEIAGQAAGAGAS